MDKRYQVFVSSTYQDLQEERHEVMHALLELDCIPSGMELFPAANESQWSLIKRVIDDCDYYLLILADRYGSCGPDGVSYTEMEYRYALSIEKPTIAFIHKDPGTIQANKCESTKEGKEKLAVFRALVEKKLCKFWSSPAELGSVVSRSLVKLIKTTPGIGWVRADARTTSVTELNNSAFLAVPMNAFKEAGKQDGYPIFQNKLLSLIEALRKDCGMSQVFCAAEQISNVEDFDLPAASLALDIETIQKHKHFILIWMREVLSKSVLIETGMALAMNKPCVICVERGAVLPFILQDTSAAIHNVKKLEYAAIEDLIIGLKRNKSFLFNLKK